MKQIVGLFSLLALALPLATYSVPARAAAAHNLQAGTHTKNPYDTRRTQHVKQMRMRHRG